MSKGDLVMSKYGITRKIFYTYLYLDPKTNIPIYVGKGINYRAIEHLTKTSNSHIQNLLHKRIKEGYNPQPIIHYEVDEETALEMEKFWINFYGRNDLNLGTLLNRTDGGDGMSGYKHTDEARKKISAANIGREPPNKGVPHSEETKRKMSETLFGFKNTQESNLKKSLAFTGRTLCTKNKPWSEARRKAQEARKK